MRRYCEKCSLKQLSNSATSPSKAFKSKSSYGKAFAKAKRSLPRSPTKRKSIVENLCQQYSPGVLSQKQKKSASTVISTEVCNLVKEFYISDAISYQAPGARDFKIIRDSEGQLCQKPMSKDYYIVCSTGSCYYEKTRTRYNMDAKQRNKDNSRYKENAFF